MKLLRIRNAEAIEGFRLRLELTDGSMIERDVSRLMIGPIFDSLKSDLQSFRMVRAEGGTVVWSNGADLCPDMLIWGGPPPEDADKPDRRPEASRATGRSPLRAADAVLGDD